jgi:hypothetical protein
MSNLQREGDRCTLRGDAALDTGCSARASVDALILLDVQRGGR